MEDEKIIPKKINEYSYLVEKQGKMNVPLKIFASEKLMENMIGDRCIGQGMNVASLPGIQGFSMMMPDAHQGYGFSIGGVAAFCSHEGCISPGGIGFDINCGVRVLATNLTKSEVEPKIKELLDVLFKNIPSGVGSESTIRLTDKDFEEVLSIGAQWALNKGYGSKDDLHFCEENGSLKNADPSLVSSRARSRGRKQLGTLGSGNHFLEIQYVDDLYDEETAKVFGFTKKDQVVIMIHTGSRGLGHQVASDFLRKMEDAFPEIMATLPEKDLIYAPINSPLAKDYFKAMCAAANYAWTNRHIIAHFAKTAIKEVFPDVVFKSVYDVAHNIAKKEIHTVDGVEKEVIVHRKGATRAFGPGHVEIPEEYREVGQPVLIPGSMGTASFILVGTKESMTTSFGSTAHGAGRVMSRFAAKKQFNAQDIKSDLEKNNIFIKAASLKGIVEEAPLVYKDVDEVVKVSHDAHIGNIVVRLRPIGVIKG